MKVVPSALNEHKFIVKTAGVAKGETEPHPEGRGPSQHECSRKEREGRKFER